MLACLNSTRGIRLGASRRFCLDPKFTCLAWVEFFSILESGESRVEIHWIPSGSIDFRIGSHWILVSKHWDQSLIPSNSELNSLDSMFEELAPEPEVAGFAIRMQEFEKRSTG